MLSRTPAQSSRWISAWKDSNVPSNVPGAQAVNRLDVIRPLDLVGLDVPLEGSHLARLERELQPGFVPAQSLRGSARFRWLVRLESGRCRAARARVWRDATNPRDRSDSSPRVFFLLPQERQRDEGAHLDAPERGTQRLSEPRVVGDVVDDQAPAVFEGWRARERRPASSSASSSRPNGESPMCVANRQCAVCRSREVNRSSRRPEQVGRGSQKPMPQCRNLELARPRCSAVRPTFAAHGLCGLSTLIRSSLGRHGTS